MCVYSFTTLDCIANIYILVQVLETLLLLPLLRHEFTSADSFTTLLVQPISTKISVMTSLEPSSSLHCQETDSKH